MATSLPPLLDVQRLSSRVIRILAGNPSKFTLQGTNTYLIGQGSNRILIDTGEGRPLWIRLVEKVLADEDARIETVICTHWHPDHVGGLEDLRKLLPAPEIFKNQPETGMLDITDGQKFSVDGATIRALHSPGHASDHMAFILEEEDAMFTGDNVLGYGTAAFEDLQSYLYSLERMGDAVNGRGYPGHGEMFESVPKKVKEYIARCSQRESEVLRIIKHQRDGSTWEELLKIMHKDMPQRMQAAAGRRIRQILHKLENEDQVTLDNETNKWRLQRYEKKASL